MRSIHTLKLRQSYAMLIVIHFKPRMQLALQRAILSLRCTLIYSLECYR